MSFEVRRRFLTSFPLHWADLSINKHIEQRITEQKITDKKLINYQQQSSFLSTNYAGTNRKDEETAYFISP